MISRRPCPARFKHVVRSKKRAGTIAACATNLAAQLGRTATDDEVASMLAMSVGKLRALRGKSPQSAGSGMFEESNGQ
jgi:hypothetical protein